MRSFLRSGFAFFLAFSVVAVSGCGSGSKTTCGSCITNVPGVTSSSPSAGSTGVSVTTAVSATFDMPMNATTLTTSTFTLASSGGAVAGTVTYSGTTATFTPSAALAFNTQYTATVTTGAESSGGGFLAANYTWTFTTQTAPAPTVTSTSPANNATGVAINSAVSATFSEAMTASTLTASTFTLSSSGGTVSGTVAYDSASNTATFTPSAALAYNTLYTATITTGAQSSSGTSLAANDTWTFTTAAAPAPTVTAESPASGAANVSVSAAITATFSEAMQASSLTSTTFTLSSSGGAVSGSVTYDAASDTATFTPSGSLSYATTYTATITTGATASNGAALATGFTWQFTTAAAPASPTVTSTTPTSGATSVAINTAITAVFSEAMNSSSITAASFELKTQGGTSVSGTVTYSAVNQAATFTPSASLSYGTSYTATLTTAVTSASGQALANYTWTFTTVQAPTVLSTTPASGATSVAATTTVTATFSMAMNASTLTTSTFTLSGGSGAVTGTVSYASASNTATFTPSASLSSNTLYTATITTGAQSSGGVGLASNYTWTFTTGAASSGAVTVDFGTTYQTIRGFGGSTAWLGPMPAAVATALFSPTSGLGLSILRLRIDPEGKASGGGAYGAPYETGEWDQELTNANEAVAANPNAIVFASPWTPPAAWKLNGSSTTVDGYTYNEAYASCAEGTGYCGGYLDPNHYADYANYLEDFVRFIDANSNANLYAISMQNEPDANTTYESCVWTPQQMDTWVASLTAGGATNPITTKLMMPESQDFLPSQAATTLSDANAQGNVSIIAGHIYQTLFGGSITAYPTLPAGDSPKEIWMTEFGPLSTAAPSWSQALSTYALNMHNAMVTGQYNAYVWWGAFGASTGSCATSAGTCGLVDNAGNVTVMGDVMGQYSKFIQPGYKRASATATPTSNVYVSAYTGQDNSGNQHYVIVAINTATTTNALTFTFDNASGLTSLTPWQSTSSAGLKQQPPVTVTNGQLTYTLPASSITTLVQ